MLPAAAVRNLGLPGQLLALLLLGQAIRSASDTHVSSGRNVKSQKESCPTGSPGLASQAGSCCDKLCLYKFRFLFSFLVPLLHTTVFSCFACSFSFLLLSTASLSSRCFICVHAGTADGRLPPSTRFVTLVFPESCSLPTNFYVYPCLNPFQAPSVGVTSTTSNVTCKKKVSASLSSWGAPTDQLLVSTATQEGEKEMQVYGANKKTNSHLSFSKERSQQVVLEERAGSWRELCTVGLPESQLKLTPLYLVIDNPITKSGHMIENLKQRTPASR